MPTVRIDLQDGFADDTVAVLVNGNRVFHREHISTRHQLGVAHSFSLDVEGSVVQIRVELPLKNLATEFSVPIDGSLYLGVSVTGAGSVSHRTAREPFGYV